MADPVSQLLEYELKRDLPEIRAILDSSIFLGNPVFKPKLCELNEGYCGFEKLLKLGFPLWKSAINENCRQDFKEKAHLCIGQAGIPYMKTKAIGIMFQYDQVVLKLNGVNFDVPSEAAASFINQVGLRTKLMLQKLYQENHLDYVHMNSCIFHDVVLFKNEFLMTEVGGKTAARAVYEWATKKKRDFIDDGCDTPFCSQNCSPPGQMEELHIAAKPRRKEIQ